MKPLAFAALSAAVLLAAGCGSSKHAAASSAPPPSPPPATTAPSAGALQAEAQSAATGDVPDNQVFVVFANPRGGYSLKYPEGWAQRGVGPHATIRDKNNIIRVVVRKGALPTPSAVRSEIAAPAKVVAAPQRRSLPSGPAVKVVYSTQSTPNPVTGKRVTLVVDRYYLSHAGKEAVVDLGTPQGVDNVDAYRLIIESFRWR
jgi:hypothetical protein